MGVGGGGGTDISTNLLSKKIKVKFADSVSSICVQREVRIRMKGPT